MAILQKEEIIAALERLGQLADVQGHEVELVLVGGAAMVLAYNARRATHDVDAVILAPREARIVRDLAAIIANERDWPEDWLNDAAKAYLVGLSRGAVVFSGPGIKVRIPSEAQLLAMKLCAWRDDVDIADARRLLEEFTQMSDQEAVWEQVEPFLVPGQELKAQYAFGDLWETIYED